MANIRLSYPAIPLEAPNFTPSAAFDLTDNEFNTLYGARHNIGRLSTKQAADLDLDYDAGTGNSFDADHLIIGRADLLARQGLHTVEVRNGPGGATLVDSLSIGNPRADFAGAPGILKTGNVGDNLGTSSFFSAMVWFRPNTSAGFQTICGAWRPTVDKREWRIYHDAGSGVFGFSAANGTLATVTDADDASGVTISDDEVYVVFVTHKAFFSDLVIQVGRQSDGMLFTKTEFIGTVGGGITDAEEFSVGGENPSGNEFEGEVLRAAVWQNILLSDDERAFLFKNGIGLSYRELLMEKEFEDKIRDTRDSLKGWWDFDEISDGTGSVIRRDKVRYQYDLTDPNTVPSTVQNPLVGPAKQDILQTFTESSAQEWRVRLISSDTTDYSHSKLFLGKSLDLGVEPSDIRIAREPRETGVHQATSGVSWTRRNGEPRWAGRIEWEGLTDAAKAEFVQIVGRNWYRWTYWLYTTESDDVFDGAQCINIKIVSPPRVESIESNYHSARIEFEEIL